MQDLPKSNITHLEMIMCENCDGEGFLRAVTCCGNYNSTGCCLCPIEIGIECEDCNGEGTVTKGTLSAKNSGII